MKQQIRLLTRGAHPMTVKKSAVAATAAMVLGGRDLRSKFTMARTIRDTATFSLLFLVGACAVSLADIQQTAPIRTTKFTGSHKTVAQCVRDRIGGRVQGTAEFGVVGDRLVVYDSKKSLAGEGLTHYSMTIIRTAPNQGIVEWRIFNVPGAPPAPLADAMVQRFWTPAQECAEQAKNAT